MFYKGTGTRLAEADFAHLADKYDLDEALIRAVNQVEAKGRGLTSSGAVIALYEPHIAWRYSSGTTRKNLEKAGLAYEKWGAAKYPKSSYPRIDRAAQIAGEELAATATSWGLGQIMGFNHKAAGYPTAVAMVKAFAESEAKQLEGMISFIKANPAMLAALKAKDWHGFARRYNGSGYQKNGYHLKLRNAYDAWVRKIAARPAPVKPVVVEPPVNPPVIVITSTPKKKTLLEMILSLFRRKK